MTLCTLNENSKIVISQLFSQQNSTTDLDVGEKYPLSSRSYLPFEVIDKQNVHFHLKGTCEKLFPNPRGGARPFPFVEFTSALHLGSWMLPSAEGLNDTHTKAELKKRKGHRQAVWFPAPSSGNGVACCAWNTLSLPPSCLAPKIPFFL